MTMETSIKFIFESSVCLGIFTLLYKVWLKKQPNLRYNRVFILLALLVSAIVPLLKFSIDLDFFATTDAKNSEGAVGRMVLDSVTILSNSNTEKYLAKLTNLHWLSFIYLTGLMAVTVKAAIAYAGIRKIKRSGNLESKAGYSLIDCNNDKVPFSFFNLVFINRSQFERDELQLVIDHELAHIRLKHSYDLLLLELILIFQWFNPFVWFLKRDLVEVHELQADLGTLQSGHDSKFYKKLLVQKALGARVELAHSFNQSLIKKRLKMINNRNEKPLGFWKPAITITLVALLAIGFGCEKNPQSNDNLIVKSASGDTLMPPPPFPVYSDSLVYHEVDVYPEFPGGQKAMAEYLSKNITYPEAAIKQNLSGKVYVQFYINKNGDVWVKGISKSSNKLFNEAAKQAIWQMPSWKPGQKDGRNVIVEMTLPISFTLK
jgi:TonB family protein